MNPVKAYDYLARARAKLFEWIRPLSQEQYTQEFPFAHRTLRRTMIEIASGEFIYGRRLQGETLPPPDQLPVTEQRLPTFAALEEFWQRLEPETRATLAAVQDWERPLTYRLDRPDRVITVSATTGDVATQMCFHEVHHRAQAMAMLRGLGVPAQNLDYSIFVFKRTEEMKPQA